MSGARVAFFSASGNLVFRVERHEEVFALRISSPGRRTRQQVLAELAYGEELRSALGVSIADAVAGRDGGPVQVIHQRDGLSRMVVLFRWLRGESFDGKPVVSRMGLLGRLQGRMHAFALRVGHTRAVDRPVLGVDEVLDWTRLPARAFAMLAKDDLVLVTGMRARLRDLVPLVFDSSPKALVHFDLQGSNLLHNGEEISVIDLDDAVTAPTVLDMATTLAFTTTKPDAEALRAAYLEGYDATSGQAISARELLDPAIALIAMREIQRVLLWPRITAKPWGPGVLQLSLRVLRMASERIGPQLMP